jgi:hypothetical protein
MHPVLICQDCKRVIRPGESHVFMDVGHFVHAQCPKDVDKLQEKRNANTKK